MYGITHTTIEAHVLSPTRVQVQDDHLPVSYAPYYLFLVLFVPWYCYTTIFVIPCGGRVPFLFSSSCFSVQHDYGDVNMFADLSSWAYTLYPMYNKFYKGQT